METAFVACSRRPWRVHPQDLLVLASGERDEQDAAAPLPQLMLNLPGLVDGQDRLAVVAALAGALGRVVAERDRRLRGPQFVHF
jgi:hypothetical protein